MRVVCAWCGAVIKPAPEPQRTWEAADEAERNPPPVSHGICPACYAEQEMVLAGMAPAPAHPGKAGGEG